MVVLYITVVCLFNRDGLTVIFIGQNVDDVIRKLLCDPMNCPVAIPTVVTDLLKVDYSLNTEILAI